MSELKKNLTHPLLMFAIPILIVVAAACCWAVRFLA